ncbi:DNA sulfur modification protein DndB [Vibrio sinaloensis]|uniref:DNA sulfur modification protein DndB n=1 Tax=Photobacterium sp. (strain ATCC 43367) TaxID=379097 RepID=UPI0035E504AA
MSEFCFDIPAVRGVQAGRVFYTINAPFGVLPRLVAFDTGNVLSRSQRDVNPTRASNISNYIKSNKDSYVLTSLTGVINDEPEFIESEFPNVGLLRISMDSEVLLFDGQHRTTGITDAIKDEVDLRGHNISLTLFMNMSLEERQQAFSDINGHTVKPSASISDTYNKRDDLPMLVVDLANTLPSFVGFVDFERNVIGKNSKYLFPVKILKDATAKLLGVKVNEKLSKEQKDLAREFWGAAAKPMLWEAQRCWEGESSDDFREQYISSHGVFLNALGLFGQCILAQYGNFEKLKELASLNIKRDSEAFVGRCIDSITGNMISNATAVKLTAVKMLCEVGCPVSPELQVLERQYFPESEFPSAVVEPSQAEEKIAEVNHSYADLFLSKWPELSSAQLWDICDHYEAVALEFGETVESARPIVQCLVTQSRKPSTVKNTIRNQFKKAMEV